MKINLNLQYKIFRIFMVLMCISLLFFCTRHLHEVVAQQTSLKIRILPNPTPRQGGGGGGGGRRSITTSIILTGNAYPMSKVSVLKDGQLAVSTIAGPDAKFSVTLTDISSGNFTFSVYGEDSNGNRSALFNFPVYITSGATTQVSGIFLPPTISLDKLEIVKGENLTIFGHSKPGGDITISVHSAEEIFVNTIADSSGAYLYDFDTSILEFGDHITKSKVSDIGEISGFGRGIGFKVGDRNVSMVPGKCDAKGEFSGDCKVNLIDFSIMAYWYLRQSPPDNIDLNNDQKIDLIDFSIMAFNWTG